MRTYEQRDPATQPPTLYGRARQSWLSSGRDQWRRNLPPSHTLRPTPHPYLTMLLRQVNYAADFFGQPSFPTVSGQLNGKATSLPPTPLPFPPIPYPLPDLASG
jgi:hypothetical protein